MKTTKHTAIARGQTHRKRGRLTGVFRRRYEDRTVVTRSQRKWQSPGRAWRRTVRPTSHTLCKCPRNNPIWGWRATDTQESVKLTKWSPWIQAECRTVNRKHWPEHPRHPAKRRRPTKDGNRPERHGARGATMRRELTKILTQINGGGHAQDIARERQQSPLQKRTRLPPRRSEGRNEWATPTWPPTEEQTREKVTDPGRGSTKQRGKNSCWLAAAGREQQAHR